MSKRLKGNSGASSCSSRRKHVTLSIGKKVDIIKKLDSGTSAKAVCREYGIGLSTLYDLKKQKASLLKFYESSDTSSLTESRKSLHQAKNRDVDRLLMLWIEQQRSKNVPLNRASIIAQAKLFHYQLGKETACEYSAGWFARFKKRHNLRMGDRVSPDQESSEDLIEIEFMK